LRPPQSIILSLGSESNATRRLNLAQSFTRWVAPGYVRCLTVHPGRTRIGQAERGGELIFPTLDAASKAAIRTTDLMIIRNPYVILGGVSSWFS